MSSDRAADLGMDLSGSPAAIAETSQMIEQIEPESPAEEELKATLQSAVVCIQSIHAGRALLAAAAIQAWDLIAQQQASWDAMRDVEGGAVAGDARADRPRLPKADRQLSVIRPAIERLDPQTEPERRLQRAMIEACRLLETTHQSTVGYEQLIEQGWRYLDGLYGTYKTLRGQPPEKVPPGDPRPGWDLVGSSCYEALPLLSQC